MTRFVFYETPRDIVQAAAPLYAELAAQQMRVALAKLMLKYSPDQPRAPKGGPDGGQWVYAGGARVAANDRGEGGNTTDAIPVAARAGSKIDLMQEERAGGHAISEHVGKSQTYLLNRVNQKAQIDTPFATIDVIPERAGSFPSVSAAEKLVNSTLSQNPLRVFLVANGLESDDFVTATFDSKTGIEAFRPSPNAQPYLRDTYGVGVVIRHDNSSSSGFRVVTAYPRNDR